MTPLNLIEALAAELKEATAHFKFIAEGQEPKKVSVYVQGVPRDEFQVDSFYPLICVELMSVEDTNEATVVSVLVTLGCYCGERRGDFWREHLNLLEEVREFLAGHRVIGRTAILQLPVYHGVVEEQSESFIFSNSFAQYLIPQPIPSVPY